MATRRYRLSPGDTEFQIVEEVGAAVAAEAIELTVDLVGIMNTANGKERALLALDMLKAHITKGNWPPA